MLRTRRTAIRAKGTSVTRIDRYVLTQLLTLFGFFALVLVLVYWVNRAVILFDDLMSDGRGLGVFAALTALALPSLIRIVLPVAAFAAALYVTNRLVSDSELVVLQGAGTSPRRLARPFAVFGLMVTLLMALLTHVLVPVSQAELAMRQSELAQDATARLLRDGQFLSPIDGVTLFIRDVGPGGELRDIFLSDARSPTEETTYTARSAYLVATERGPQLVMVDGLAQSLRMPAGRLVTTSFADLAYDLGDLVPGVDAARSRIGHMTTLHLLTLDAAATAAMDETAATVRVEIHERVAIALQALVIVLLGFATLMSAPFSRFGIWRQVVTAIFLVVAIKLIETAATRAVAADPAAWPLLYLPAAIGLALSAALLGWSGRSRRGPGRTVAA